MKLLVTINGPGEVAGWLRPLAAAVARDAPHVSLTTVVLPCQLASGRESELVSTFAGVSQVERLGACVRRVARARLTGGPTEPIALVLHLGGDPFYAVMLARLTGAAAWTYGTSARYRRAFERFLVPDERTAVKLRREAVAETRIDVVGQLVTDSVRTGRQVQVGTHAAEPTVVFLTGSRDVFVEFLAPYFASAVEYAMARGLRIRALMLASPFVGTERVAGYLSKAGWTTTPVLDGIEARSPRGATIRVVPGGLEDLEAADLVVTIPGTNTLQLAALGMPHLVVTPGHYAERIPVEGLWGLVTPNWWGMKAIRRAAVYRISRRKPFLALPNIIAGRTVVPEIRGDIEPWDVAAEIRTLISTPDALQRMSAELTAIAGPPGAATRLVRLIMSRLAPTCASAS